MFCSVVDLNGCLLYSLTLFSFMIIYMSSRATMFGNVYLQKVEQSAAKRGVPPQQFVDEVSVNFRELLDLLNISNDAFIRTTDDAHKAAVQVRLTLQRHCSGINS